MTLLTKEQQESYENSKIYYICKKTRKYHKVRDNCHSICSLKYSVPNYCDYHLIIKELVDEFKKQFTCLRENTENVHNLYSCNRKRNYKN